MSEPEKATFRQKLDELLDRFRAPTGQRPTVDRKTKMDPKTKINVWYIMAAVAGFMLVQNYYRESKQYTTIPYSQFQTLLDQNKIDRVWIEQNTIQGTLKEPEKDGLKQFVTTRVSPDLSGQLDKHHVIYSGEIPSTWLTDLLSWVLPAVIFFGLWMFVIRRFGQGTGGLMAIGKSRAKIYVETDTKVTFADVAGVDEAKEELKEVVDFLKDPKATVASVRRIPKGVLLIGPPGTGKTLLARAVAGEAGVKFFSISGSEFVEMFVGVGAARVRDLFEQARKEAPAIVFIDELDALGGARGAFAYGGNSEKEQTLNQLLVEMDGFDPTIGVIILAATNRPEILDSGAAARGPFRPPGSCRPPRRGGPRSRYCECHLKKAVLAADVDPRQVAELTPGLYRRRPRQSGQRGGAAGDAARRRSACIMTDFTDAVERIVAGLEKKNRLLIPKEKPIVAYHESGPRHRGHGTARTGPGAQDLDHPARHRRRSATPSSGRPKIAT